MECNTHMDLKEIHRGWTGIIWFKTGRNDGLFVNTVMNFRFHKTRKMF